jgi:hypothetical protein
MGRALYPARRFQALAPADDRAARAAELLSVATIRAEGETIAATSLGNHEVIETLRPC